MHLELITTGDGSHSIYVQELNEVYHSRFGAINESRHVFIDAGLKYFLKGFGEKVDLPHVNILEVGFGTGLNSLLTLQACLELNLKVDYFAIEPFPVENEILKQLNYPDLVNIADGESLFRAICECDWGNKVEVHSLFSIIKSLSGIEQTELSNDFFDLVYFDAFAPEIAPELWILPIFHKIFKSMKNGGVFVTYSAKGAVRRNLQRTGFKVERIPGPEGKREMLRAVKS